MLKRVKFAYYELKRQRRLWLPDRYDHGAYVLMNILGRWWLWSNGWKREYRIYYAPGEWYAIDLAHPGRQIALEADGGKYHQDIVREQRRNEYLGQLGWTVRHYRFATLRDHPDRVREDVKRLWRRV